MKTITKYILPRYTWFRIWFAQYFRSMQGLAAFADLVMNTLLQKCMAVFKKYNKANRSLLEKLRATDALLEKCLASIVVAQDDFDEVRSDLRSFKIGLFLIITAETGVNYWAIDSMMPGNAWPLIVMKLAIAFVVTWAVIFFFKALCSIIINKPKYGQAEVAYHKWSFISLTVFICLAYESAIYYLCIIRHKVLEGGAVVEGNANNEGLYFLCIFAMLLPLATGWISYHRSLIVGAYKNYLRLASAIERRDDIVKRIAVNDQVKESYFKAASQDAYSVLQEFRLYFNSYHAKRNQIPEAVPAGHFSESQELFIKEASFRLTNQDLIGETTLVRLMESKAQAASSRLLSQTAN